MNFFGCTFDVGDDAKVELLRFLLPKSGRHLECVKSGGTWGWGGASG